MKVDNRVYTGWEGEGSAYRVRDSQRGRRLYRQVTLTIAVHSAIFAVVWKRNLGVLVGCFGAHLSSATNNDCCDGDLGAFAWPSSVVDFCDIGLGGKCVQVAAKLLEHERRDAPAVGAVGWAEAMYISGNLLSLDRAMACGTV